MMALYGSSRIAIDGDAFNHVRVKGPLGKELRMPNLLQRLLENLSECVADNLAFTFWVGTAFQPL